MTIDVTKVAARHLGRPVLMEPAAAAHLMGRVRAIDPNFTARPSRIGALVRKLSGAARSPIMAMDDDDDRAPAPSMAEIGAYHPLYVGEVDDQGFCWSLKDGIAMLQCDTALLERGEVFCGAVWHGYDTLLAAMREAAADERVRGLFLRAASPGGVVAGGLDTLATWMRDNRAAAGGKPIWVYADQACSAMYWISAQADRIVAPDVGMIGSIGAVLVHEDWSGALAEAGVKVTAIQFGAKKTDGNWWESLSPRAQQDLQAEIDQCGRNFVAAVAAGRPVMSEDKQLATEAGVFLGRHDDAARSALALGLCDDIMSEEAAFAALAQSVSGAAPVSPSTLALAASAGTEKEQPMATTAEQKAARLAALKEEEKTLSADPTANAARLAAIKAEADGLEDDGEEDDPAENPDKKPEANAKAIAESPEAKTYPKQALAAISAGLTLDQFKAMVADTPRTGRLNEAMTGAPRLNADAPSGGGKVAAPLDPRAIYDRRQSHARKAKSH
jgi:ClpP class serine protease